MKQNTTGRIVAIILGLATMLFSCKKDDSKQDYGFSKIYMPQAIATSGGTNNYYPLPSGVDSSTYNYKVDYTVNKVKVIFGTALSGTVKGAYSVKVSVDNDTIQKLLVNGTFNPATYMLMPSSMYSMPDRLDVGEGSGNGSFYVSLDIDQLKLNTYFGKFLLLAVKISDPTAYEINKALSTAILIVDVNTLVIGPSVDVTAQYIKNPGNPFQMSGLQPNQARWGTLTEWTASASAMSHGGYGGWAADNGGVMDMESGWGSNQILNGKIYQTITLPKGTYAFDLSGGNWTGGENFMKDIGYIVVAPNATTLPDYANIASSTSVFYVTMAKPIQPMVNFQLSATTSLTLGVVINYAQTEQGFKTKMVRLVNYPKHL